MKTITEYLKKWELTIIGGRPAMGKTTFALNLAQELTHQNQSVLYCMLEMDKGDAIQNYNYTGCFMMDDTPRQKVSGIRSILQKQKDESNPITTVIIDYVQLMDADLRKENRDDELLQILQDLKRMAVEENISVTATSQLCRARTPEPRKEKDPHMDDLPFSSCWDEVVDCVFLLYRPAYFGVYEDRIGETENRMDITVAFSREKTCRYIYYEFIKKQKNYQRALF